MNIVLINHYAGSPTLGMEFRPYYLAREWTKQGHNVTIFAASYSHLRTVQPVIRSDFQTENIDGIAYLWIKTNQYAASGLRRVLNMLIFVFKLLLHYKKIARQTRASVVIASSTYPLDIYPAFLIAKKNKAKLIFELHDLWPLSPMLIGNYSKYHPFIWLMQRAENFACRKSDCFVSLLGNAHKYLVSHGLIPEKFVHIPNGFTTEEISDQDSETVPPAIEEAFNSFKRKYNLLIGYAGGHAPSNALKSLINVSHHYESAGQIGFILIGNGSEKYELVNTAKTKKQANILFFPPVKKSVLPFLLRRLDILYAGGVKSILHQYGTSFNKITDYMLAEKPIIFAVDELNSIIQQSGCGVQISAEDENELIKAIDYLSGIPEQRIIMGKNGRQYALKRLNYSVLADKFIDAITKT
jgi:glycosyltransferase involved in cell wall biosynthesis